MSQVINCPWSEWTINGPETRIGTQTICQLRGSSGQSAMLQELIIPGGADEAAQTREWIQAMRRNSDQPGSEGFSGSYLVRYDAGRLAELPDGSGCRLSLRMEPLDPIRKRYDKLSYPHVAEIIRLGQHICVALEQFRQLDYLHKWVDPWGIFYDSNADVYKLGASWDDTFLAPELVNSKKADHTADVYSLGLVLYWLLNDRRLPFLPPLPAQVTPDMERESFRRRCQGETLPPPIHGSRALKEVILTACAFRPRDRYQTAGQLLEALRQVPQEEETAPDNKHPEPGRGVSENKTPLMARLKPVLAVGAAVLLLAGMWFCVHLWRGADCTSGEECRICGKPRGEALGHTWAQTACGEFPVCSRCGVARGWVQEHDWNIDSCVDVRTCSVCSFTETEPQGHDWLAATCMESSRCSRCGLTEGGTGDHTWMEATRDAPRTCTTCGVTEGIAQIKHLIHAEFTAPGYPNYTFTYAEDCPLLISVEDCVEFVSSELLLTDAAGTPLGLEHLSILWMDDVLSLLPKDSLEPGIYTVSFGDTGIRAVMVYGYLGEIYLHSADKDDGYFLINRNWKNGRYLTSVKVGESINMVTTDSPTDVASFSIRQLMARNPDSYESRVYWYCAEAETRIRLRTYYADGTYLAADENGVIYLSAELTEECYWVVEDRLI